MEKEQEHKAPQTDRYSEEHTLPSDVWDGKVTIMEMTTREESLLTKQKKMRDGTAIEKIIQQCTAEALPLDDLLVQDRYFLMLQVRRITYGNDYTFRARCPQCGATFEWEVDLSKIESKPLAHSADHVYELTLPRSGRVIRWKHLRGRHEKTLLQARSSMDDDALIPVALGLYCVGVDGNEQYPHDFFDKLGGMDSMAFRDDINSNQCGPDLELEMECRQCDMDFTLEMPVSSSFFWPSLQRKK